MESRVRIVDVTLSLDTSAYTAGDVLAATQAITGAFRDKNRAGTLQSLQVIDSDDQAAAFDIYFFDSDSSLGAENGAPDISDALALSLLGKVAVAAADYKDLGGVRIASYNDLQLPIKPATDTQTLYVGAVNGAGTPTFSAAGLKLRLGIID